ncbi:hypothetical protein HPP92_013644 [Vanilla planifolia]|uniref:DUF7032 domain-containing protein n=1 Tax=Vanilla planifolia TaxID=51239 RepID=A0A835QSN4_VANPL|nr:hypothetical protein HPP92_013644 [Vanilla planifolia]
MARTEKEVLEQTLKLLNSAISSSHSTRLFPAKWKPIRDKLERLRSNLAPASFDADSRGNPSLAELLEAISATAHCTKLLAQLCGDDSYGGGKLLMKSNLDLIAASLELHIKHLDEKYDLGILISSLSIVLSKPAVGASREDMRIYVRDIFSRLRIGCFEMKARALASLNQVLHEDERYVRAVAAETTDGIGVLVKLLDCRDVMVKEEALRAVSVIAGFESYRGMLVMSGVIPPLIRILEQGNGKAKERAAHALKLMTQSCDNAWLVSSQGGVLTLLRICGDNGSSSKLANLACSILRNLCGVGEIRRFMVEQGAVVVFLKLLRSKEEASKLHAMELLLMFASDDEEIKKSLTRDEFIDSLLGIINHESLYSSKAREIALRCIEAFFFTSPASLNQLVKRGFLHQILFFLRNGEVADQELALKSVSRFCSVSDQLMAQTMGDMGFMPELLRLLQARPFDAREAAAEALCSLVLVQKNRRKFIEEDHNVDNVLQLLDPREGKGTKKLLLSALMSLTDSSSGRKKVSASIYLKNLEKLAEAEVAEAKKRF